MRSVVVHYQEIALKGRNRPWFLRKLVRHVRDVLADQDVREVRTPMGRIEVRLGDGADPAAIRERLTRVFGIANFAVAGHAAPDP
jgi:tRNA uracil 4-sulfurtransferase